MVVRSGNIFGVPEIEKGLGLSPHRQPLPPLLLSGPCSVGHSQEHLRMCGTDLEVFHGVAPRAL
jgi:hypothetical protein